MLCDRCRKNPPSVLLKTVSLSRVREERVCASCAGLDTDEIESVLPPLLAGLFPAGRLRAAPRGRPPCPECRMTASSFEETGLLGCPACYGHFAPLLPRVIRRLHGADSHRGKAYEPS